ncbi:hypothetical protein [Escherichia coli]|uniref:hypothetical protein n=1 Tax=Escherichia coli TaxID=562 RepID=UPI0009074700
MRYVQGNDIYLNIFRMLIGRSVPGAAIAKSILYCAGQLVFKESGHHLTGTDTIYFVTVRLHMHNSTYSSIFCFSMSVLLSRRRVSGDLTCR